jgi:signal transduction histidine kinase
MPAVARSRVLLVDDNPANRFAVGFWLREAGFEVLEAASGGEALARMDEQPDLVVLDVRLPDIMGFEVLRRIRTRPDAAGLPVLHLSASFTTGEYRAQGLDAGADGYLTHPVEPREFVATVRALLRVRAAEAERERLLAAERSARAEAEAARAEAEGARAEAELARQRAEEANAAKSQFLANMSHELRTPLNAISGYVQLLEMGLHGPVTGEQRRALGRVDHAQRRLLGLINDVLNYARLEGGRVEYDIEALDVRAVVAEVAPLVEPQLAAKGVALEVRLPASPCVVWADREKLGQVLVNLLSNAAKFTEARHPATGAPGRVTVEVAARRGEAGGGPADSVFLRVADTGRGVPRDKQDAIFEPFVQVQTGYTRGGEGTGLGLAISRDLARGMGGDLRVRSAPGEGAAFTVTLRRAADGEARGTDRRSGEERRVDDERRSGDDRRGEEEAAGARHSPSVR